MFPSVFLTTRMPITAGETPTVPILKTLSTMIFQISWAVLLLLLGVLPTGLGVHLDRLDHRLFGRRRSPAPLVTYQRAISGPIIASAGSTGRA